MARWLWRYLHLNEIVARHLPHDKHSVAPVDVVAIKVINRRCAPLARLYGTLDARLQAQQAIEDDLETIRYAV